MKNKKVDSIKTILGRFIKDQNFEENLNKLEILNKLDIILGKSLNKYVKEKYFSKGIIYLKLSSSVLRNELSYKKQELIDNINKHMSEKIVEDIIFK